MSILRIFGLAALLAAASSAAAYANPSKYTTMRAYDFYSKFGLNTSINAGEQVSDIESELSYLGLNSVRDEVLREDEAASFGQLASAGVKLHLGYENYNSPVYPMSTWLEWIKTYIVGPYPGSVVGLEGPNEVDTIPSTFSYNGQTGVSAANQAQTDLYDGVKRDYYLRDIKVYMWPLAFPQNDYGSVGDMTNYCDGANLHDYYFADNNTSSIYPAGGSMQSQIPTWMYWSRMVCNRTNWVTTETGWVTPYSGGDLFSKQVSEDAQAKLLLNDILDHAMLRDCDGVYVFDLRGGSSDTSNPGFGVFHDDGTPKESATAIKSLVSILKDQGANDATFRPNTATYLLYGMPSASGNFALAKSNGHFDILLWNETPIWNLSTESQIYIPSSSVTVYLPAGSSGSVYDPINSGTSAISTFSNTNGLIVSLNDSPLVIDVKP